MAELSKIVHRHPNQGSVWLSLGTLLLYIHEHKKLSKAASNCIRNAMHLGKSTMDVTKVSDFALYVFFLIELSQVLCLVSLAAFLVGDNKVALKSAQKAVHCYPHVAEGWVMLISALSLYSRKPELKIFRDFVVNNLDCTSALVDWLKQLK